MKKKIQKKSDRVLRTFLHKAYLNLLQISFNFIKIYYIKDQTINSKRDPLIYGSLVQECSLTELQKKNNFLQKLFLKLKQNEFYENYFFSQELLKLLFLPSFNHIEHYILIQHHILENGAVLLIDLKNYFDYVKKELTVFLKCIAETYNLKNFNNSKYLNYNMRLLNQQTKDFIKKKLPLKKNYQKIQGLKHQFLGIQLLLLKEISKSENKKDIKHWCYNLTIFTCNPDKFFCGYV